MKASRIAVAAAPDSAPLFLSVRDWQREMTRLGVSGDQWRVSEANKEFLICDRYIHVHMYTYMYMYIHMHTCTCTYICVHDNQQLWVHASLQNADL